MNQISSCRSLEANTNTSEQTGDLLVNGFTFVVPFFESRLDIGELG